MPDAVRLPRRPNRARPFLGCTLSPVVDEVLRARAERERRPLSRVVDEVLRAGLGLPDPSPPTPNP